jgi:membrane protein DedA with SNARE-associated domain
MKRSTDEWIVIGALSVVLVIVMITAFTDIGTAIASLTITDKLSDFQLFAIIVSLGYDAMPTVAQQFSLGAIHTELLQSGFDPNLFVVLTAFALLGGQLILYLVGMIVRRVQKGSLGNLAGKNHFLHKYHFLIYLIIPFVGILGDLAMIYSGHQRINPLKFLPFLFIGDLISSARWIYPAVAQLEISKLFGA